MADDIAEDKNSSGKASPVTAIVLVLVAALVAGGSGFAAGSVLFAPMIASDGETTAPARAEAEAGDYGADAPGEDTDDQPAMRGLDYGKLEIVPLDPITTNIGVPSDVWVRMELSLAVDPGEGGSGLDPVIVEAIQADLLAYMRTTRLQALSLPSGFQHLVTDLESRAALRSEGAVKRVYVKALLLE